MAFVTNIENTATLACNHLITHQAPHLALKCLMKIIPSFPVNILLRGSVIPEFSLVICFFIS